MDIFNYTRRVSSSVCIGDIPLGGDYPVRIQTMADVSTMDTVNATSQAMRVADAGAVYIRFTAQGEREARNLANIKAALREKNCYIPMIADIHFNARVADIAAGIVEKVRINPGNYAPTPELARSRFRALIGICKERSAAIRIGVNHGSLSERIMREYGDTPEGMVASAMEFLNICRDENFSDVVISMKASNVAVMIKAVHILVATMEAADMYYPLHLGVTEAGEGEDGRIKSAAGIGALLADGIGDTIRVSLSEEPEKEIPVARKLASYIMERRGHEHIEAAVSERIQSRRVNDIGGGQPPVVLLGTEKDIRLMPVTLADLTDDVIRNLCNDKNSVAMLTSNHVNPVGEMRAAVHRLWAAGCYAPVILRRDYDETDAEMLTIKASADLGAMLIDGYGDGVILNNKGNAEVDTERLLYGILQATRRRITKTEYISCPGCGRTLFNLQSAVAKVKAATSSMAGLKIAVMGCIVNGPGEMADADYGYVGAGRGKVSLYKGKDCILKNIPEEEAVDRLLELIHTNR